MTVIDEYLKKIDEPQRAELNRIRKIVKLVVPDAQEVISYGMPVMKYNGKYLIGFAAFKNHMSVFPGAEPIESTKEKLAKYKLSKGTIQFTLDNLLPESIIIELVNCRIKDIKSSMLV